MKLLITEDHRMFREVIRKTCLEDPLNIVVGETESGRETVRLIQSLRPDLVILDLNLPDMNGFEVINKARALAPWIKFLIVSGHCDSLAIFRVDNAMVSGFIDKDTSSIEMLKEAIYRIRNGGVFFSDKYQQARMRLKGDPSSFDKVLSEREREVLALIGQANAGPAIAMSLGISISTVETHRRNIMAKLGVNSTMGLIVYARENGFVSLVHSSVEELNYIGKSHPVRGL